MADTVQTVGALGVVEVAVGYGVAGDAQDLQQVGGQHLIAQLLQILAVAGHVIEAQQALERGGELGAVAHEAVDEVGLGLHGHGGLVRLEHQGVVDSVAMLAELQSQIVASQSIGGSTLVKAGGESLVAL